MNEKQNQIDPTENVKELVKLSVAHLHSLQEAESRRVDQIMEIRAAHEKELREAEAKRIDAIRAVDVNAVAVANEKATAQASVLANQLTESAEALRSLVNAAAASTASQLSQLSNTLTDRITAVERAQYTQKGSSGGMRDMWGWIFGIIMGVVTIWSLFFK